MIKKIGISFISSLMAFAAFSQNFGGFPASTKWKQINSDTVRVIFTAGAEAQANRIATLIHKAAADTFQALGARLRKINVVLQSRTTTANGYVALAPFRSEYYLIPNSNLYEFGNLNWAENLAIHEYRHVQQYNNFRNGISKGLSYIFGEQGQALGNALSVPDWFFEGDAVHSETALTTQGRGRLPYFLSGYQSLWLSQKNYNWQKLRNGSLKDYVPNHYQLGYLLVNYGYLKYGDEFWKKVTHDASAFKGLFYPFQKAVKQYTGLSYKTFRTQALQYYKEQLRATDTSVQNFKTVTRYFFPQWIGEDSLVYLKTAYNRIPAFYLRSGKVEKKIALANISSEEWFDYADNKILYTAFSTNARRSLVNYSDIITLDLTTHRQKRLTAKKKYYTPSFSQDASKIAAVCFTDSLQTEIHILDAATGEVQEKITPQGNEFFAYPKFLNNNSLILCSRSQDSKMALLALDLQTLSRTQLIPYSGHTISVPFLANNSIYFTANFEDNDDIYELRLKDKRLFKLTSDETGNYYPSAYRDSLVYAHFTSEGLEMRKKKLGDLPVGETSLMTISEQAVKYPVAFPNNILGIRTERYSAKRYDKGTGLFNFHSYAPSYSDPEFTFSLYSDNILSTFTNEVFYRYNQNENSSGIGWNTSYGGFFPVINAGVEYTFHRTIKQPTRTISFNQIEARLGYNIPLNLTKGKMYRSLNFGSDIVYNHSIVTGRYKDSLRADGITYLSHRITWAHYLPQATQHIYPKFGYTVSLNHRHTLRQKGYQFLPIAQLFLPSIANHSIVLVGSWQETDTSNTVFANRFANSRGYEDYYFSRMWKLAGNYHFPIVYPDLGIASVVYFQRLRGNLFYDYTRVYRDDKLVSRNLRSVGAELFFDTKWWNQLPVSFGVRASRLLDDGFVSPDRKGNIWFDVILPVGLIP